MAGKHGFPEQMKELSSYTGTTTQLEPWSPLLWKITKSLFSMTPYMVVTQSAQQRKTHTKTKTWLQTGFKPTIPLFKTPNTDMLFLFSFNGVITLMINT